MFVQVDVKAGKNCKEPLELIFNGLGDPRQITRVMTKGKDAVSRMHRVTGWSSNGPCEAYAMLVEDSGAGNAMLIVGGDEGLRLMADDGDAPWDLGSDKQWGEPCLLLEEGVEMG